MKTKYWVLLFAVVFAVLVAASLLLIPKEPAAVVEVWSEGKLLHTLSLSEATTVEITTDHGTNTVVVAGGKAWVSHATCPDGTCMEQGKRNSGQIVCLPNRLVLKFKGQQAVDGLSG